MAAHKRKPSAKSLTAAQRAAAAKAVEQPVQPTTLSWDRDDAERQRHREGLMTRNAYWVWGTGGC